MRRGIHLKDAEQVARLRAAGRVARGALDAACAALRPGVTTRAIDEVAEAFIRDHGATPEFKGYYDYPATICISIDEEVVHGIPGDRVIAEGDLVSVDVGARLDGFVGDNAATVLVGDEALGERGAAARHVRDVGRTCLERAVAACRPGARLSDVARAVQDHAVAEGLDVVRDYAGHGIGRQMHEEPSVPNYVDATVLRADLVLEPGLCIAIEPMVCAGSGAVRTLADRWTVVTADGGLAAHWEDVVAITEDGATILTRP